MEFLQSTYLFFFSSATLYFLGCFMAFNERPAKGVHGFVFQVVLWPFVVFLQVVGMVLTMLLLAIMFLFKGK